ncbi:hypothetical protein, partial [Aeromonas veronii]|uniref:hypothetical protein n=1 Tax=Aeromonas veronii TaxID=654 RepID=UPI002B488E61
MMRNILHKKEIITITTHVGINANRKRVHRNKNLITQVMDSMRDDEQRTYQKSHIKKSPDVSIRAFQFGGEGGIRTLDTLPYTHFPGVLLQP